MQSKWDSVSAKCFPSSLLFTIPPLGIVKYPHVFDEAIYNVTLLAMRHATASRTKSSSR